MSIADIIVPQLMNSCEMRNACRQFHRMMKPLLAEYDVSEQSVEPETRDGYFRLSLNIGNFAPEEISIKLIEDNSNLVVTFHQPERQSANGYVERIIRRRYVLPTDCDTEALKSELKQDGVLEISAPLKTRKEAEAKPDGRSIPIQRDPKPSTSK